MQNKIAPKLEPCGTPLEKGEVEEVWFLMVTKKVLSIIQE